jgi:hypothetical protein
MREAALATFESPSYDMFANCTEEEKREWHVFLLFLVKHEGAAVHGGVVEHINWILRKQFKTVEEWLGPEGKKLSAKYIEIWRAFAAEHAGMTIADIMVELDRIHAYQQANPHPSRAAVAGLSDALPKRAVAAPPAAAVEGAPAF